MDFFPRPKGIGLRLTETHSLVFRKSTKNINRIIKQVPTLGISNEKPALISAYGFYLFGYMLKLKISRPILDLNGELPAIFKGTIYTLRGVEQNG